MTDFSADTTPSRADAVAPVAYVGASGQTTQRDRGTQVDGNTGLAVLELFELSRHPQGGSVITELQQQFEQLLNGGAPAEEVELDD